MAGRGQSLWLSGRISPILLDMHTDLHQSDETRSSFAVRALAAATAACLVVGGLLLWASRGDAVFSDMVLAAIAWCF